MAAHTRFLVATGVTAFQILPRRSLSLKMDRCGFCSSVVSPWRVCVGGGFGSLYLLLYRKNEYNFGSLHKSCDYKSCVLSFQSLGVSPPSPPTLPCSSNTSALLPQVGPMILCSMLASVVLPVLVLKRFVKEDTPELERSLMAILAPPVVFCSVSMWQRYGPSAPLCCPALFM